TNVTKPTALPIAGSACQPSSASLSPVLGASAVPLLTVLAPWAAFPTERPCAEPPPAVGGVPGLTGSCVIVLSYFLRLWFSQASRMRLDFGDAEVSLENARPPYAKFQ